MFNLYPREAINLRDENQNTLLMIAARGGNLQLVKVLLERDIEMNTQDVSYLMN